LQRIQAGQVQPAAEQGIAPQPIRAGRQRREQQQDADGEVRAAFFHFVSCEG
jgi:hypothetical protein